MLQRLCVFALFLVVPLPLTAQQSRTANLRDQLDRPYVALFDASSLRNSRDDLRSLRSSVEQEKKQQIDTCRHDETDLRAKLAAARKKLQRLNEVSARDTPAAAAARMILHDDIAAASERLRRQEAQCTDEIPFTFDVKLAKLNLLDRWPRRSDEIARAIQQGHARKREHGDVDDIGYRKLTDDQDKDIRTGEQAVRQMTTGGLMPVELSDADVQQYIRNLAANLAENSDLRVPLHVTVLDSNGVNAMGLPGGFLFLTSGLVLACETESELAGVISRQIGHIAARHATRSSKLSTLSKFFVPVAQVVTGVFTGGVSNAGAYYGMNYGFQGLGVAFDRAMAKSNAKAVKEADQLGIQYAWKAGFDPKGFIAFLDSVAKLKDLSKSGSLIDAKPPLGERLVDAFAEIAYLPSNGNYIFDSEQFKKTQERLKMPQSPYGTGTR